jgi:toxin YhaV
MEVARLRQQGRVAWEDTPRAKLLRRVLDIVLKEVPADPGSPRYEQGNTLGADARGWRRVKFLGRLRLFFRFDTASKIIVYAWLDDENTLRKAGAATNAYTVFRGMLIDGNPPHDWSKLLDACRFAPDASGREELGGLFGGLDAMPAPARATGSSPPKKGSAKRKR